MKQNSLTMKAPCIALLNLIICGMQVSLAQDRPDEDLVYSCMALELPSFDQTKTIAELRQICDDKVEDPITRRSVFEKTARSNPFVLLPHKPNFVLPITYAQAIESPYTDMLQGHDLKNIETKFQFSLKYIVMENAFTRDLDLQIAFTSSSWWQAYSSNISAPFRETNYEPELIASYNKPWSLLGIPIIASSLSLNHQSNGQSGTLSRSWNRVIAQVATPTEHIIWSARVWWRLPEDTKKSDLSALGDDNPNIEKYFGYGEFGGLWKINNKYNLDIMLRNNFRTENNKGAIKLGWSFPLSRHLRGYIEYFNGYGESLIYYKQRSERIGLGFKLSDWL